MLTPEQRAAGWIEHDGGPCPVPPDSLPAVLFGSGYISPAGRKKASHWMTGYWSHHWPWPEQIIAYRPENPHD